MGVGHSMTDLTTGFRNSKKSNTNPAKTFRSYSEDFSTFHKRIKNAIIENLDWSDILKKYDDADTLFYLDPPYVHSTRRHKRGYSFEMNDAQHIDLISAIQNLRGKVVLSGYGHDIYDRLGWEKITTTAATQNASKAVECLWICPKSKAEQKQISLNLFAEVEKCG
jgi:DNA adenine methylase